MTVCSLGKIQAKAVFMRVLLPALLGLGAALLPALSWGQSQSDIQAWQKTVQKTLPPSQAGCFQITYPATQWQQQEPCSTPTPAPGANGTIVPQVGGSYTIGGSYVATATGGPISSATGSFTNVTGTPASVYSLQINTNYFDASNQSQCTNSVGCIGWAQFAYVNTDVGQLGFVYFITPDPLPKQYYMVVPSIPLSTQLSIVGQTGNGMDSVILYNGQQAYAFVIPSFFKELPEQWQDVEFNVFGYGNGATANFSSGSSVTVKASIDNGSILAPSCSLKNYTSESNNLYFSSPCCPYPGAADGTLPSIVFSESSNPNGTNPGISSPACSFSGATFTPTYTLTAGVYGSGGTISPSGSVAAVSGTSKTFTFTPNPGYQSGVHQIGNMDPNYVGNLCIGTLTGNTYTTNPIYANCQVQAQFSPVVTASAGTGGTISPAGAIAVTPGQTQTFTLTPNTGYQISSVGGTCGGTLSGTTYTTRAITVPCTVTAVFAPQPTYIVTASAGTGGTISPSGYLSTSAGTTRTFTLTPNANYQVSSVGGTCGGTLSGNTYTTKAITAACTVTAVFTPVTYYTVTAYIVDGYGVQRGATVTRSVQAGQTTTFVASSSIPFISVNGTCGGTVSNNTITTKPVTANCTIIGVTGPLMYYVTASAGTGGTISPSGALSTTSGTTRTFTLTPNANYQVSSVGGTCGGTLNGNTYTTNPITAACTVTAAFTAQTYTVTASAGTGGTISPAGNASVSYGETKTYTMTPSANYTVHGVGGTCGVTSLSGNTFTTKPITANCTVVAIFTAQTT